MDDYADDDTTLLQINDPYDDAWDEESFLGRLMEAWLFDEDGYADVEAAIIAAVTEGVDFPTLGQIIRIFERILLMLKRHVDANDAFRIENLDDGQVATLDERVRYCLVEISVGNAPDMTRWEN